MKFQKKVISLDILPQRCVDNHGIGLKFTVVPSLKGIYKVLNSRILYQWSPKSAAYSKEVQRMYIAIQQEKKLLTIYLHATLLKVIEFTFLTFNI